MGTPKDVLFFLILGNPEYVEPAQPATRQAKPAHGRDLQLSYKCRLLLINPLPLIGIIIGVLILRPFKMTGFVNHGSTLLGDLRLSV